MTKSILKKRPDVIETPDHNGGKTRYIAADWLLCTCGYCQNEFMVSTNLNLTCPHGCGKDHITAVWGQPQIVFVQEHKEKKLEEMVAEAQGIKDDEKN